MFDVVANASYIANRNRARLDEDARLYFSALGIRCWSVNPHTDNPDLLKFDFRPTAELPNAATQVICDAFMAQHDNSVLVTSQKINNQAQVAVDNLIPHLDALINLPAADVGYAAMGRAMAFKDGAGAVVVNGIVDRATAVAYLTAKPEWIALTVAQRNWLQDELEMFAFLFQILVLVLRR